MWLLVTARWPVARSRYERPEATTDDYKRWVSLPTDRETRGDVFAARDYRTARLCRG